jgi:hypothetical protein
MSVPIIPSAKRATMMMAKARFIYIRYQRRCGRHSRPHLCITLLLRTYYCIIAWSKVSQDSTKEPSVTFVFEEKCYDKKIRGEAT